MFRLLDMQKKEWLAKIRWWGPPLRLPLDPRLASASVKTQSECTTQQLDKFHWYVNNP